MILPVRNIPENRTSMEQPENAHSGLACAIKQNANLKCTFRLSLSLSVLYKHTHTHTLLTSSDEGARAVGVNGNSRNFHNTVNALISGGSLLNCEGRNI